MHSNEDEDGEPEISSVTTSYLAEEALFSVAGRKILSGRCLSCRNCSLFCRDGWRATCCTKRSDIGAQEEMIRELYLNIKERRGIEENWGLVIQKLNEETEGTFTDSF